MRVAYFNYNFLSFSGALAVIYRNTATLQLYSTHLADVLWHLCTARASLRRAARAEKHLVDLKDMMSVASVRDVEQAKLLLEQLTTEEVFS